MSAPLHTLAAPLLVAARPLALLALLHAAAAGTPCAARAQSAAGRAAAPPAAPAPRPEALRVSRLVGDHMVIQRGAPVPVWGWAAPGTAVRVEFRGRSYADTTNAAGEWEVALPATAAGGPYALTIAAGAERIAVRDVLVGDVWLCSGQSNMEWPLSASKDAAREIAAAREPRIRHFKVPTSWAATPEAELAGGAWEVAEPGTAGRFTAVGWFFATALRRSVDVPIGLLNTTWGGSRIEAWMTPKALAMDSAAVARAMDAERDAERAARDAVRARLGGTLPTVDAGTAGGRAAWADPALDDAAWDTIPVPALWESHGYAGLDGVAWYRTTVTLTAGEARRGVRIGLGAIDDSDVAWVNGRRVGGMTSAYSVARVYDVPAAALRAGPNVIAVRVEDTGGGGGIAGAPSALFVEAGGVRRPIPGPWRFRVGVAAFGADGQRVNKLPTALYNKMVHPLVRYPVAGALWYQGESNADGVADAEAYRRLLPAMIADWRRLWNRGDVPFLVVQLPGFTAPDSAPPARSAWATLREAQAAAATALPNVATVVAIDLGEADDIHPRDKRPVGERLALAARRVAYGDAAVAASGPTYRSHRVEGGRVVIELAHADGLTARGGAPDGFAVAGADRRFVWADARIEGGRVVVWSDRVRAPVAVRYAWGTNPARANLFNRAGLPAAPFRTDSW